MGEANRAERLANDEAGNKLAKIRIDALLKKRYYGFSGKYGIAPVVRTWTEVVRGGGLRSSQKEGLERSHRDYRGIPLRG